MMEIFCAELLKWGKIHNITGYKSRSEIERNIAASLAPLGFIADFKSALDIGSGCGFPALPLAAKMPRARFFLIESNAKKASFLKIITLKMGLKNVEILRARAEDVDLARLNSADSNAIRVDSEDSADSIRANFDVDLVTSRAVGFEAIKLGARFLREGGHFLLYRRENLGNSRESKTRKSRDSRESESRNSRDFCHSKRSASEAKNLNSRESKSKNSRESRESNSLDSRENFFYKTKTEALEWLKSSQ